ncbi:3-keto-5-aminohexanoate cleavage protein [Desulfoferula mesophila]|uniref:3-keto-5-aminohexanoate cleavage protein n=1 Tax=Desulfoferula mesophila TaxID=3058419 RepID=A0AAU9EQ85_9BACT|nr:3-keto-5-aminohexanoate cleavage protein [Desulfoferula mesophilus]
MESRPLDKNKVVITVAQTGAMSSKSMNPNVPEQPDEIAQSAYDCFNEGAAICHIHARGKDGQPTADTDIYQDIHDRIRAKCNMIIQDSTGGGPNLSQEERIQCLKTGPEMASLNMGSLMRIGGPYKGTAWSNMPEEIDHYVREMAKYNVKPEMEVFNHAMLVDVRRVIEEGLVAKPYYVNIVLGMRYQGAEPATPDTLYSIVKALPPDTIFNVTGVGSAQTTMANMSMLLGGCVRVGMEDNLYYRKGEPVESNAQLVARIVRIARELGKEPATPEETRAYFGLDPVAA